RSEAALGGGGITVDGVQVADTEVLRTVGGPAQVVENTGEAPLDLTLTTFGVPEVPRPAGGTSYAIERAFFTLEGEPFDPTRMAVGDRFVTVLRVQPFSDQGGRLMVDDPLPAGVEIDNPALLGSGDIAGVDWLRTVRPEAAEYRSDRFLAAVDWRPGTGSTKGFDLAYVARAVSPGAFHAPAARVEDMYRPARRAWTDTGRITITP
ncbi:MAG: alpha-2-macroglobulin family protein, partial [Shimia sp.]